jgi:uncharacterized damage-inducible protein DinB
MIQIHNSKRINAMTHAQTLLAEFEQEAQTTRKFLARLPEDKLAWRPHEKSMTAGQLAWHLATIPDSVLRMALQDKFPMPDTGKPQPKSLDEILTAFDEAVAKVKGLLPTVTDEQMQGTWTLVIDGKEVLSMPRAVVMRKILLNHWYHHRGQFGVYLRLVGAKVPSAYGPSGDEMPDFLAA